MNQETKQCQNCKKDFVIEPDDFAFYEKMKVPPPTFCPECRVIRRLVWRNECVWYRRKCDATGKNILSMIAPDMPYKIYEQEYWRSDVWDPMEYGRGYDFSKPFFAQFRELFTAIPHPNLIQKNVVNSEYSNYGVNLKNCYFVGGSDTAEDSSYLFAPNLRARDCFDIHATTDTERVYDSVDIEKSQGLRFCQSCIECSDSYFLYDCRNCMNCIGGVGLRNKQHYIFNQPYSREEYSKKLIELRLGTYAGLVRVSEQFDELKLQQPRKYASITKSEHVTGDDIINARNCIYCFSAKNNVENCKHSFRILGNTKDGYDAMTAWNGAELFYEVMSVSAQRVVGSALIWGGFDIGYSYNCFDCNNIFGCIGLHNKQYCILNRQYTKEEYGKLIPQIIKHMADMPYIDKKNIVYGYGEFFPSELCPFAYNETLAQDYFQKTAGEAIRSGFRWREPEDKKYHITKKNDEIPEDIHEVSDSIVDETFECLHRGLCNDHCATAFRVTAQELQFLKKMNIPLPRLCPFCRRMERLRLKNPLRLWHRKCQCASLKSENGVYQNTAKHQHSDGRCPNEFETPYAPDRPEIVYCEQCYQQEIV